MEFSGGLAGRRGRDGAGRGRRAERRRRAGLRLGMERLEERMVLSTLTWSGADTTGPNPSNNWSDKNNWIGGKAPAAGDSLIFPAGLTGAALTSTDDIAGGTFGGITIQGSGYTINGAQGLSASLTGPIAASQTTGSSTINLSVDFGSSAGTVTAGPTGATLVLGGTLAGTAGIAFQGSGTVDLTGANANTGTTTVAAGTLLVDGTAGAVAVSQAATLGGTGTVASVSATGGTISPGHGASTIGTLTDTGDLSLSASSNFDVTLGAANNDQLVVGGSSITLASAALNVSLGSFVPTVGQAFTILHSTAASPMVSGTFGGLTEGKVFGVSGYAFQITYAGGAGHDVVLTAVAPPPVTWTGADAGAPTSNTKWSDANNWKDANNNPVVPAGGDLLIFPAGLTGSALTSTNDLATNTIFNALQIQGDGYAISGNGIGLAGAADDSGGGTSTVSMPITFNPGSGTVTVDQAAATLALTGVVTATSGLTKAGAGTLALGANDAATAARVGAGTLLVDGSGAAGGVTVVGTGATGATLAGTGTVASIATTAGAVSPGLAAGGAGTLTDSDPLALDANSAFNVDIGGTTAGTNYDQLVVGGAIDLAGAKLNVSLGSFVPRTGDAFVILKNNGGSAIAGTFAGLPNGNTLTAGGDTFVINYLGGSSGHDVVLTAVTSQTATWTGADATAPTPNHNWSDPKNWAAGAVPANGSTLIFPSGLAGAALSSNDDIAGGSYASILIQAGYTIASAQGLGVKLSGPIVASHSAGIATFDLPVDFGGAAATVIVQDTSAGLLMGGAISDANGLTKQGSGGLDLQSTNTYTGTTTVSAGTLIVDGKVGPVSVASGAALAGTGTVASIGSTAGAVGPGSSPTTTGTLTDTGNLTLDATSSFSVTINGTTAGTTYDQLVVGGPTITLGGASLNVTLGSFAPTVGQTFTILHNTSGKPLADKFNVPEGGTIVASGYTFAVNYNAGADGHDVVLTATNPATLTWTGTAATSTSPDDNWSNKTNWVPNAVPAAGDLLVFPKGLSGGALTSNNDLGPLTLYGMTIQASGYTIQGEGVTLTNAIDASQPSSSATVSMPITFAGAGTVTVDESGATLLMKGAVDAPAGLTKTGSGTLSLTADDGQTPAIVSAGTLVVDGTVGNVSVNTGTTLAGTGIVGALTTVAGTVSPGDPTATTTTGILTDLGSLVLDGKSTLDETLGSTTTPGTGYDQLVVQGSGHTINLNGATLSVTIGTGFPSASSAQKYTIISNTTGSPITGTFAGLPEGGTVTAGSHQFAITYKGGASGHDVVLTELLPTTVTVTAAPTNPVSGQAITLTATVAPSSGSGTPTGTVSFTTTINGSTVNLGTGTLNASGTTSVTTTQLTAGSDVVTATYTGDTAFSQSSSAPLTVTVGQAATTTTVTVSPDPSTFGQLVTLTAVVAAQPPGSGSPAGSVTFYNGTAVLGTVGVGSGVATFNTTKLPVGTDTITAVYTPPTTGASFTASTSTAVAAVVEATATTVTLVTSNANPFALEDVLLTAIVSATGAVGNPTGTVTFETTGGTVLGTATLNSAGAAAIRTHTIPIGPQTIVARYQGNGSLGPGTSLPLSMVVGHASDLYINQVYQDVFGTPASYGGSTYWIALLNAGYSRDLVTSQILNSQGAKVSAVEHVYESLLGRPATSGEVQQAVRSGNSSLTPTYVRVFGSKEFFQTQGHGTDDGFLKALARDWFGAPFPATVQARLSRRLAHGASRSKVARDVITSPSGVRAEVNSIYESVLGRPATAKEETTYGRFVRRGDLIGIYQTLFTSNEFLTKYVRIL